MLCVESVSCMCQSRTGVREKQGEEMIAHWTWRAAATTAEGLGAEKMWHTPPDSGRSLSLLSSGNSSEKRQNTLSLWSMPSSCVSQVSDNQEGYGMEESAGGRPCCGTLGSCVMPHGDNTHRHHIPRPSPPRHAPGCAGTRRGKEQQRSCAAGGREECLPGEGYLHCPHSIWSLPEKTPLQPGRRGTLPLCSQA